MNTTVKVLTDLTTLLTTANVGIPIIFGLVGGLAMAIKSVTGTGPSATEIADIIDATIAANDARGKSEIARLKALLGQ